MRIIKQSYYIFSSGELKRNDNTLLLIKDDGTKSDIPIERVYDIYVFSELRYNTKVFDFLAQQGICIHMFNYYDFYTGSFYPREKHVSGNLLIHQVLHYTDKEKRLYIAKEFVIAGVDNIYRNLRYYNERGKDLTEYMSQIIALQKSLAYCNDVKEIMGFEGSIRKKYYEAWNIIINREINFEKRVRRPPDNMINTLISFLNSIIYSKVLSEIYKTQINPTISYLHEPSEKRFSLALDVSEIFKPLIVDRLIFSLLNKNIITESDFEKEIHYIKMKESTAKKVTKELETRLQQTIKHRTLNRSVSYKHLIRIEIYKLIKHLLGEKEYEGFRIWW